jgi:hypothetical protein
LSRKPQYASTLNDSMAASDAGIERDNDQFGGYDFRSAGELGAVDDTSLLAISSRAHFCAVGFSCGEMSAEAEERMGSVDRWSKKTGCIPAASLRFEVSLSIAISSDGSRRSGP